MEVISSYSVGKVLTAYERPIQSPVAPLAFCSTFLPQTLLSTFHRSAPTHFSPLIPHRSLSAKRRRPFNTTICLQSPPQPQPNGKTESSTSTHPTLTPFNTIRKLLTALSLLGFAETAYLTVNKLFSSPGAICATQGCLDVLSGPFSSFLGVPLTLFGATAYAAFAYLCIWPLAADEEEDNEGNLRSEQEVYQARDAVTRPLMLALATALFVFSTFLVALLVFVIQSMCPYCVVSAALSTSIFALTAFVARAVPNFGKALRVSVVSAAATATMAAIVFFVGLPIQIRAQPPGGELQSPPEITMQSTSDTLRIAGKLRVKNTKMYGAFWCSHCYDQKQRFGKKAFDKIEYIECDKYGTNSKYQICRDKRIPGYPTWEIDGELYPGEIDIPELERLVDESGQ